MAKTELKSFQCENGEVLTWNRDYAARQDHNNRKMVAVHIPFPDGIKAIAKQINSNAVNKTDFERDLYNSFGLAPIVAAADTTSETQKYIDDVNSKITETLSKNEIVDNARIKKYIDAVVPEKLRAEVFEKTKNKTNETPQKKEVAF